MDSLYLDKGVDTSKLLYLHNFIKTIEERTIDDHFVFWKETSIPVQRNEIKTDVVETLECLLESDGTIIDSNLEGSVLIIPNLLHNSEISLHFKTTFPMQDFSIHKCAYNKYS